MILYCSFPECTNLPERNGICASHNHEQRKAERNAGREKKVYKIPAKSKKQIAKDKDLHKVYSAMDNGENIFCTGCGKTHELTHSHLLPRSLFKQHEANPVNLTYHCLTCHELWATLLMVDLLDYTDNMNKMKSLEPNYVKSLAQKQHSYFINDLDRIKIIAPFL